MARKRVYSELEEVDTLEEVKTASNMTVHEALTTVSPVKKGKRSMFFDGTLADTTPTCRFQFSSAEKGTIFLPEEGAGKVGELQSQAKQIRRWAVRNYAKEW